MSHLRLRIGLQEGDVDLMKSLDDSKRPYLVRSYTFATYTIDCFHKGRQAWYQRTRRKDSGTGRISNQSLNGLPGNNSNI
jgi:hypothetical protein